MRNLVIVLVLLNSWMASGQNQTYVTIDTKGHMGLVKNVMFSPDGSQLYSISDDKTIRVWDLHDGVLIKTFRGYIEENYVGMLNSGALSDDGNMLAVGGFLGEGNSTGDIRVYSAGSGKLLGLLEGNSDPVVALQFTPDGNYLFSGTNSGVLGIWNLNNSQGVKLEAHKDGLYGLAVSPDGKSFFSCSYDRKMIIWDLEVLLKKGELEYTELEDKHTGQIRNCAWSPNGKHIVTVGFDNKVILWSSKGKFIKEIDHIIDPVFGEKYTVGDVNCVAFSADGSKIVVGTNLSNDENAIIYSIPEGEKLFAFKEHTNAVISCDWFGESTIATAGGNDREIFIWDANTGEVKHVLKGNGKRMWEVAAGPGYTIGFGQKKVHQPVLNDFGDLTGTFDLSTLEIGELTEEDFTEEVLQRDDLWISYTNDKPSVVSISNGNEIKIDAGTDGDIRCMSLTPDNNIVIGCAYRTHLYDTTGQILREFKGHSSEVYSLAFSDDGRFMYTSSGDQTVKIWELSDKGELYMTYEAFIDQLNYSYGEDAIAKIDEETLKGFYNNGYDHNVVYPIASLFVTEDQEWILWTKDNYYATSRKGSRYVGFHVNQGKDKEAKYYAFEQFDLKYNRPDQVLNLMRTDTTGLDEIFEKAYLKRLKKMGVDPSIFGDQINAPELTLNTQSQTVTENFIRLSFLMSDNIEYLDRLFITNNDVPTTGKDGFNFLAMDSMQYISYSMKEYLTPGVNRIQVWCTNTQGVRSARETVNIYYKADQKIKPDLYVLGIGASKYVNDKMDLNYAAKDINDFVSFYTDNNTMYDSIHVTKLLNEEITLENIGNAAKKLKQSKITDHVLVYVAGHGVLDANFDYYLATYDMNFNDPAGKGFAYSYLEEIIDDVPARIKTIFMDACHSGELDKEEVEFAENEVVDAGDLTFRSMGTAVKSKSGTGYLNSFHLMKNIFTDLRQSSGATIIASAGGAEYALEGGEWNNGVFTYALLDGLKSGKADLNNDGDIMLSEVQSFLKTEVSELTNDRQKPISRYENISNDYVFWKVRN
ncbi:MAG: WD40 repeat domain-containing protein [Crocinitomicaceae bacterium]|nr:WD40 repeat domain-containing protein [Crocinitomicaceae bacterium]